MSRATLYRPEYVEQARKLCLLGATDVELAAFWSVDSETVVSWRKRHPAFRAAILASREIADATVADRLYNRAMGYSHPAVKIFMPPGATEPVYAPYTEHYPPDTQAASLWLRNRQPRRWRDRVEHTGTDGGPIHVTVIDFANAVKPATE